MTAFKDWLNGLTSKTTPVDADELYVRDSSGTPGSKKLTWANLVATLMTAFKDWQVNGTTIVRISVDNTFCPTGIQLMADTPLAWSNSNTIGAATGLHVTLYREGYGIIAQRLSTNAQTSRLYGTHTDASNYRRLTKTMSTAGVAEIKPEGAGTGASGNVLHISGLPTSNPGAGILWNDSGTVKVGT